MLFNSLIFLLFFAVVYPLYLGMRHRAQNIFLLAASYVFYGYWDWRFLSLIFLSTLVDYFCGLRIHASTQNRRRRLYLAASLVTNLGILFFFKYYGFFAENLAVLLNQFGLEANLRFLKVVLPVGISFYTFQTLSYTIDIYRKELEPTRNFFDFALFVSFFPQLVAGPIERAKKLLPQVEHPRSISFEQVREGAWLILYGFYMKVVLADNLAPFVDEVFDHPDTAVGFQVPVALLAFALQIYGDFAGYSNIARGISKLMGFELMVNFRMPYFAVNPSDFWRRWHISLSTWLRDYLYIPLGGNRGSQVTMYRNLALTMILGGFWHGASWNFIAWGVYHGLLLIVFRVIPALHVDPRQYSGARKLFRMSFFFLFTLGGWLLFRINSMSDLGMFLQAFDPSNWMWNGKTALLTCAVFGLPVILMDALQEKSRNMMVIKEWPLPLRFAVYSFFLYMILISGVVENRAFIYFQF